MKINITKATLLEGLQVISSGVSARTTLPILHNFLMETQKGKLRLVRTDMEMATVHYIPSEIEEAGSITVPLKEFTEIIKNLPTIKADKKHISSCVICTEDIKEGDEIMILKCPANHFFHGNCIKKWLLVKTTCPMCRSENVL